MARGSMQVLNRAKAQVRIQTAAQRVLKAVCPLLAKLPCRSEETQNSMRFLPTPDEMAEARGSLMDLDAALTSR